MFLPAQQVPRTDENRSEETTLDPAPLSLRQLWSLTFAVLRELGWGLPFVARDLRRWRQAARAIPDAPIRHDALSAITAKRSHIDGAALFSIVPRARSKHLMRTLVSYQIIWDFLDSINERSACAGLQNGTQLHLALADAVTPGKPIAAHYLHNPWRDDGDYLRKLVIACRAGCAQLPAYADLQEHVVEEARRGLVCAINHHHEPVARDLALRAWVAREFPGGHEALWFELAAAASTDLTIFALLARASEAEGHPDDGARILGAYFPWASALAAMLDSYVDQAEDAVAGDHSYIAHYATAELAIGQICTAIRRSLKDLRGLRAGEKHVLIVACMFAMYLSKRSALTVPARATTNRLLTSGGSLTRVLHPVLRLWRAVYGLSSA